MFKILKKYDVLIIGSGASGYYCAKTLARSDKKVCMVENEELGGTAFATGALPIKNALEILKNETLNNNFLGKWNEIRLGYKSTLKNKFEELDIDLFYGEGEFFDENTFQLNDVSLRADFIVLATGTKTKSLDGLEIDEKRIISHKSGINFDNLKGNIVIIGGNVEGIELAVIYSNLDIKVTILEKEKSILPTTDEDLSLPIKKYLEDRNVNIITGTKFQNTTILEDKIILHLDNTEKIEADKILIASYREANLPKGTSKLGIEIQEDRIKVDEYFRTKKKNIFAIGDINGKLEMAHMAILQGINVARYILEDKYILECQNISSSIFTVPEIAGIGKQENELKKEGINYRVSKCYFKDTFRGWNKKKDDGFVKIIASEDNIILGIWMIGKNVSECIGLLGICLNKKIKVDDITKTLMINPTLSEAILEAALKII